jgi:hypothetical protein
MTSVEILGNANGARLGYIGARLDSPALAKEDAMSAHAIVDADGHVTESTEILARFIDPAYRE